ncbi:hypothetical protein [Falsiroseomonas sp. HW251]|uniref:hypothetical protein n=1 Tax=Falsiroseomonas sp. HW251 TaxID=3390998 RepID=UPI003D31E87D
MKPRRATSPKTAASASCSRWVVEDEEETVRARCVAAGGGGEVMRSELRACIGRLDRFASEIEALAGGHEPHQIVMLIDHRRARDVMEEAAKIGRAAA